MRLGPLTLRWAACGHTKAVERRLAKLEADIRQGEAVIGETAASRPRRLMPGTSGGEGQDGRHRTDRMRYRDAEAGAR